MDRLIFINSGCYNPIHECHILNSMTLNIQKEKLKDSSDDDKEKSKW